MELKIDSSFLSRAVDRLTLGPVPEIIPCPFQTKFNFSRNNSASNQIQLFQCPNFTLQNFSMYLGAQSYLSFNQCTANVNLAII